MDEWIVSTLSKYKVATLSEAAEVLRTEATEAFKQLPGRSWQRRHAFMMVGWSVSSGNRRRPVICTVSNPLDENWEWLSAAESEFRQRVFVQDDPKKFSLCSIGVSVPQHVVVLPICQAATNGGLWRLRPSRAHGLGDCYPTVECQSGALSCASQVLSARSSSRGQVHSCSQRHASLRVRRKRSVSAWPCGVWSRVHACWRSTVAQARMKAVEVGWPPWSRLNDPPWPRAPWGNWRLTAMSSAASQGMAVPRRPA